MNPLHEELYSDFTEQFGVLADALIGDAAGFASIASQPHRPRDSGNAWTRFAESVRRLHRHVAEHAVFGFDLPDVEDAYRPVLLAALDFAAAVACVDRILDTPEHGEWITPALSTASAEVNATGGALERTVFDAFGAGELTC